MTTFWLGINSCFAVKRWPRPPDWAAVVRDELGVDLVQHCADLVDIEAGRADLERQAAGLRDGCAAAGLTLHSTFTAYSANLLLHPDRERRDPAKDWYQLIFKFPAGTAGHAPSRRVRSVLTPPRRGAAPRLPDARLTLFAPPQLPPLT